MPLLFFGAKLKTLPNGIETAEEDLIQDKLLFISRMHHDQGTAFFFP
jgi:hypothetical protein